MSENLINRSLDKPTVLIETPPIESQDNDRENENVESTETSRSSINRVSEAESKASNLRKSDVSRRRTKTSTPRISRGVSSTSSAKSAGPSTSKESRRTSIDSAASTSSSRAHVSLEESLIDSCMAIKMFFNSEPGIAIVKPWAGKSMYHSLTYSIFLFCEAMISYEEEAMFNTQQIIKKCIHMSNKNRKVSSVKETFGWFVRKKDYNHLTPVQIHGELIYAKALLLKSVLAVANSMSVTNILKAGWAVKSSHSSYKVCEEIFNKRTWTPACQKVHFECGLRLMRGVYNIMPSLFPSGIARFLETIGFKSDKLLGLNELFVVSQMTDGFDYVHAGTVLLGYYLIVIHSGSYIDGDLVVCESILESLLETHPQGSWFLFFKGRLELLKGNVSDAINWYQQALGDRSNITQQFEQLCLTDLIWASIFEENWDEAHLHAQHVMSRATNSNTRVVYGYLVACTLLMKPERLPLEQEEIDRLMNEIPTWRTAGAKRAEMLFYVNKTKQFWGQNKYLALPAYEHLLLENFFKILAKNHKLCTNMYNVIEKEMAVFNAMKEDMTSHYKAATEAVLLVLKGECLIQMGNQLGAKESFLSVIELEKLIKHDDYIIPYSLVELALVNHYQGNHHQAIHYLEKAGKHYKGSHIEPVLTTRISIAMEDIKACVKG